MIQLAPPLRGSLVVTDHGWFGAPRPLRKGTHYGLDFRASTGTPVVSSTSGTVARIGVDPPVAQRGHGGGNYAIVRSVDAAGVTYELGYMHLDQVDVAAGDIVEVGAPIGLAGASGTADGAPHLHFQVKQLTMAGTVSVDPTPLFQIKQPSSGGGGLGLLAWLAGGYLVGRAL